MLAHGVNEKSPVNEEWRILTRAKNQETSEKGVKILSQLISPIRQGAELLQSMPIFMKIRPWGFRKNL